MYVNGSNLFNFVSWIWQSSEHHLTFKLEIQYVPLFISVNVTNDIYIFGNLQMWLINKP